MANRARPLDVLTIRPPSAINGSSLCVRKKTPLRCIFIRLSNASSVVSAKGAMSSVDQEVEMRSLPVGLQRVRQGVAEGSEHPGSVAGPAGLRPCYGEP